MKRTTIMLPPDLKVRATRYSAQRGISLGELIRQVLEKEVSPRVVVDHATDSFFADRAVYEGECPADLSEEHDHYLYQDQP